MFRTVMLRVMKIKQAGELPALLSLGQTGREVGTPDCPICRERLTKGRGPSHGTATYNE
ncbi:hypothetical protein [Paenibacillus puerhi]|uniref:hypothetical protein n=1 Tax=Paenibacillus puerhi TaxID=2692622 RepID=UPI001357EEF5|nr:hypothetical protein [Paenibacillus puerhi]